MVSSVIVQATKLKHKQAIRNSYCQFHKLVGKEILVMQLSLRSKFKTTNNYTSQTTDDRPRL